MRSSSFFIILIFLIAKVLQLVNFYILTHLFNSEQGSSIMMTSLLIVGILFAYGLIINKLFSRAALDSIWVFLSWFLVLVIFAFINPALIAIFFVAVTFLALIGAEAEVLRSLNSFRSIPQPLSFLLTLFPVLVSYQFTQTQIATPQLFYIVSSVFALLASYSARFYGGGGKFINYSEKAPPIWYAFPFLTFSGIIYYLVTYSKTPSTSVGALAIAIAFYAVGALIIFMSINASLKEKHKT